MKAGPSEPPCRRRLQTTMSCFGQKPRWLTSWLKGVVLITSGMDERDERKRTSVEASKCFQTTSKLGFTTTSGRVWRGPTNWPCGVRCIGGVTLIWALERNLRTWPAMPREKAQAENPRG